MIRRDKVFFAMVGDEAQDSADAATNPYYGGAPLTEGVSGYKLLKPTGQGDAGVLKGFRGVSANDSIMDAGRAKVTRYRGPCRLTLTNGVNVPYPAVSNEGYPYLRNTTSYAVGGCLTIGTDGLYIPTTTGGQYCVAIVLFVNDGVTTANDPTSITVDFFDVPFVYA